MSAATTTSSTAWWSGEGEETLLEAVERAGARAPLAGVPGLMTFDEGRPRFTRREVTLEMAALPLISYADVFPPVGPDPASPHVAALNTSRGGCRKDCNYCLESRSLGRQGRPGPVRCPCNDAALLAVAAIKSIGAAVDFELLYAPRIGIENFDLVRTRTGHEFAPHRQAADTGRHVAGQRVHLLRFLGNVEFGSDESRHVLDAGARIGNKEPSG